ncbi:MAG TPA: hypothetical protein VMD31_14365 [Opitutaceae bacterium]|nr:hypothetical protein [Opitutaceae bacterium]
MKRNAAAAAPMDHGETGRRVLGWGLGGLAALSFLLLVHVYGVSLLPDRHFVIRADQMQPLSAAPSFAYVFAFDQSEGNRPYSPRSRTELYEAGRRLNQKTQLEDEVRQAGGGRWSHEPGRIVFSSTDNSDPRRNGRTYVLASPMLYTSVVGGWAAVGFAVSLAGVWWLQRRRPPRPVAPSPAGAARWRWHVGGACLLLVTGLYCNTGTLAPYANTNFGIVDHATGYIYNTDHEHFRVLFDFVDGKGRAVWDKALFLRRILFPVLAWPLMKLAGFEEGGALAALLLNTAGFLVAVHLLRRRVGERGAIFAAWVLALYPGAAYWGGLPYPYALIVPASLLLMLALLDLPEAHGWRLAALSLAMGVAYLGYDLGVLFLPASLLTLVWHRRPLTALLSALCQVLPLALWLAILAYGLRQPLQNSNTRVYWAVLGSYFDSPSLGAWWAQISNFSEVGLDVFFGANFIFLPALFLGVVALNPCTSRIRLAPAEGAVLAVALGLFLVNNLAPPYFAWPMRGTWIARLYQPVFPALVLYLARWWQALPPLDGLRRTLVMGLLAATTTGNALIVFGPILDNPGRLSEYAFYRFYNHTDCHWVYEATLKDLGRRPLGFPRPRP